MPLVPDRTIACRLHVESGATIVEAAVAIPLILLFVLTAMDFLRISYSAVTLQYVASQVGREMILKPQPPGEIEAAIKQRAAALGVKVTDGQISYCPSGSVCPPNNPGGPNELIALQISVPMPGFISSVLLGHHQVDLKTLVLVKNEPYE